MKDNLIIFPFAFAEGAKTGANLLNKRVDAKMVYIRNAIVASVSAKINNPDCDVAFVSNFDIEDNYKTIFKKYAIQTFFCPFDSFRFDDSYDWCLAFYKLCALKYVLGLPYKNVLCLDSDTYTRREFSYLWGGGVKKNIILYDRLGSTLEPLSILKSLDYVRLSYNNRIQRVGGEFFAASISNLRPFINKAEEIFDLMKHNDIRVPSGDEYITTLTAGLFHNIDFSGGRFITRLETGPIRHLCPRGQIEITPIWHVPSEKKYGLLKMYDYIISHNALPQDDMAFKIFHIDHRSALASLKATALTIKKCVGL